jgi:hypothetical protein
VRIPHRHCHQSVPHDLCRAGRDRPALCEPAGEAVAAVVEPERSTQLRGLKGVAGCQTRPSRTHGVVARIAASSPRRVAFRSRRRLCCRSSRTLRTAVRTACSWGGVAVADDGVRLRARGKSRGTPPVRDQVGHPSMLRTTRPHAAPTPPAPSGRRQGRPRRPSRDITTLPLLRTRSARASR